MIPLFKVFMAPTAKEKIGYLSNSYQDSDYLFECSRGKNKNKI